MQGDKSSRAQILRKAAEYITFMRRKQSGNQQDIEDLKRQNSHMEKQIRVLERAKASGNYNSAADILEENGLNEDASTMVSQRPQHAASAAAAAASSAVGSEAGDLTFEVGTDEISGQAMVGGAGARVIAPGQSLLLTTNGDQPPRKKIK